MEKKQKSTFSGSIGFVLASAGSAVGVGNLWRFPYLAAQNGGGLFILIYLALVFTFGFSLLITDIAIGRKTGKHPWDAFGSVRPRWGFLGKITFFVPALIITYYTVIGGWVTKYAVVYITGQGQTASGNSYFTSFISSPVAPIVYMLIFLAVTALIVFLGVDKGIERFSCWVMPALLLVIVGITVFSLTLTHTDANGVTRTGLQGLAVYLVPNFEGLTFSKFLKIMLDAMSQLFFSLSVSMGIMITYGSYVKKDVDLNKSVSQIEIFDTGVALLAGMMIIPAVYAFSGTEGMAQGPGLMFVSLPKVFAEMGVAGPIIGFLFFVMVLFAALTSSVSIMETLIGTCIERFHTTRRKVCLIVFAIAAVAGVLICFGYNYFYFEVTLPNGSVGQLLDVVDYISNSFMMPLISLLTCIFIGWIVKPKWIEDEITYGGCPFRRRAIYSFVIRYAAPVVMLVLFLKSIGIIK
jgi:NSS family neurotransmitter:Na+ symporter